MNADLSGIGSGTSSSDPGGHSSDAIGANSDVGWDRSLEVPADDDRLGDRSGATRKVMLPEPVAVDPDGDGENSMVGRRRFLLLGLGGSAAALIGGTAAHAAAAAPATVSVWRLSANWGYAVPPKNVTRCRCQACRNHAANKIFASKAIALDHRIHPCCVCQPYSVELLAGDVAALFASSPSGSADLRNDGTRGLFEAAVLRSLAPAPEPSTPSEPSTPAAALTGGSSTILAEAPTPTADAVPDGQADASLPETGVDHEALLAAAGVLMLAGVAATVAAAPADPD